MDLISGYKELIESAFTKLSFSYSDSLIQKQVDYVLTLGGKRLRPAITLMCNEYYGGSTEVAMPAALALEIFHNFTLVHDDIMDEAPIRRGKECAHIRYGIPKAILTGDYMMILSYKLLEEYAPEKSLLLIKSFNKMAMELCEGQQMDMEFEDRDQVEILDYLQMIEKKTAVLLAACLQMGGICADAPAKDLHHLYEFGKNIGIAFQIQDDVLDTFGDEKTGKQKGGDIIQNKKTYLYLKALEVSGRADKEILSQWYQSQPENPTDKINEVIHIFDKYNIREYCNQLKEAYSDLANSHVEQLSLDRTAKDKMRAFGEYLVRRNY
jgi:geranylgeranyl diphosphate synthase, type II